MTSTITLNSSQIDANFPIPGINQSSQGFRNNFDAIKKSLDQGAAEITSLQSRLVVVTGDVLGTSAAVGTGSGALSLALALPSIVSTPGTYNSLTNDVAFTVNSKGQVTTFTSSALNRTFNPTLQYSITATTSTAQAAAGELSLGYGTSLATFQKYTFDTAGRVVSIGEQKVTFGVNGHPAARGRIVAGGPLNTTMLVDAPSPTQFTNGAVLTATGNGDTGLEWQTLNIPQGTVLSITEGPGIDVQNGTVNPIIKMDIQSLTAKTTLADTDQFAFNDFSDVTSKKITLSNVKAYLAQSFLAADVGATAITSSHANGIVLSSSNGITLNTLKWPATIGTTGQVLAIGSGSNLTWQNSTTVRVEKTYYVSDLYGNNTTGDGAIASPFKTITQAMTAVANDGVIYTIAILGGTYTENVNVSKNNVIIKALGGASKPILTGVVTIASGTIFTGFEGLKFDRSAVVSTDLQPSLYAAGDLGSLQVLDCDFIRGSGVKAQLDIINLSGTIANGALFDGCSFQGQVNIALTATGDTRTVVSNVRHLGTREFGFKVGANLTLTNIPVITGLTHTAGDLVIENVGQIVGKTMTTVIPNPVIYQYDVDGVTPIYSSPIGTLGTPVRLLDATGRPVQNGSLVETDGTPTWLTTTGIQAVTVGSTTADVFTGVYSTSATGTLSMYDVSMFAAGVYAPIIKVGNAGWTFTNVERRSDRDVMFGPRVAHDVQVDAGDFMPRYSSSTTGLVYADDAAHVVRNNKIDPQVAKAFHVTLVGNSHLSLKTPSPTSFNNGLVPSSSEMLTTLTVIVKQDATGGRTLKWSSDTLPIIKWQGNFSVDLAANAVTIYTFYYQTVTGQWIGSRVSGGLSFASATEIRTGTSSSKAIAPDQLILASAPQTLTDGATIAWDLTLGYNAKVTLGGNRTVSAPTNPKLGMTCVLGVIQDGTGSRTVTWDASFDWGAAGAPVLSTGAGKRDFVFLYCYDAVTPAFRASFNKSA